MRIHALKLKTMLAGNDLVADPFDPARKVRVRDAQILGHRPIVEREDGGSLDEKKYAAALIGGKTPDEVKLSEVAAWEERLQDSTQVEKISPHVLALPNIKLFEEFYASEKGKELNPHRREHTRAALRYNLKYAFVEVGSDPMIFDRRTGKRYATEKHKKICAGDAFFVKDGDKSKRVLAWDAWFGHPARAHYRDTTLAPCGKDANGRDVDLEFRFNTWRGFATRPKRGDWSLFERFLREVVCARDENHFRYLIGWKAHLFQRPYEKPGVAIAMIGGQGTGKGTTGEFLIEAVGEAMAVYTAKDKHLAGDFSVSDDPPLFHFHDESTSSDKKVSAAKRSLISEVREQTERKGKDNRNTASFTRYMFATNEADGFDVGSDDRRHFVLHLSDAWKQDTKRFKKLRDFMLKEGGLEAMVFDLMYRVRLSRDQDIADCWLDLTTPDADFDVRTAPMTTAKRNMIEVRLEVGAQTVLDMLRERRLYAVALGGGGGVDVPLNYDAPTWIDKDDVESALADKFGKGTTKTKLYQTLKDWGVVDSERNAHKTRGHKAGYRFRPIKEAGPAFAEKHKLAPEALKAAPEADPIERVADTLAVAVRLLDEMRGNAAWYEDDFVLSLARAVTDAARMANGRLLREALPMPAPGPIIDENAGLATVH